MSRDRTSSNLTIAELGQVLTRGLMLYRTDWQTYLKLSLKAYLWLWIPFWSALYHKLLCNQEGHDLQLTGRG